MNTRKQCSATAINRFPVSIRRMGRREEGASLVIFAFILMILLGFAGVAVDGGNTYHHQQQMQVAADAAAIGGVRKIARDAGYDAVNLEIQNLGIANRADVVEWTYLTGNRGVHVVATANVTTFFAKLFGYDVFTVSAEAEAEYQPVGAAENLFPLTMGCDCVEDGAVTLVDGNEPIVETEQMTETIDLVDDVDTTYQIDFLGRVDRTWTYEISEVEGRDLAKWGLEIASCLEEIREFEPCRHSRRRYF